MSMMRAAAPLCFSLYIEPVWLQSFNRGWATSATPEFFDLKRGHITARIRELAHEIAVEPGNAAGHERLLQALMTAVIGWFAQRSQSPLLCSLAARGLADWQIRRTMEIMRDNPGTPLRGDTLAREADLSRAHLYRLFGASTQFTPRVYANTLRMELTLRDVVTSVCALAAIGDELGSSAPAHFCPFLP